MSNIPSCLVDLGDNRYQCSVHGFTFTATVFPVNCNCERMGEEPSADFRPAIKGTGDYLHDAILKWVGEGPTRQCGCTDRIAIMNHWAPAGCREHLDQIVDWMMREAEKRGWWKYAVAVPGSRYFIKRMILVAIKKAEANPLLGDAVTKGP